MRKLNLRRYGRGTPDMPVYQTYSARMAELFNVDLWPLWEAAAPTAESISGGKHNAAYSAGGITYGEPGIGDGKTAIKLDGATGFVDIYSAGFAAAFSGAALSVKVRAKVSGAGVWTDGVERYLMRIRVDASNVVTLTKSATNNTISASLAAGGVTTAKSITFSGLGWFDFGFSAVQGGNFTAYLNGVAEAPVAGVGVWVGVPADVRTLLGASIATPANVWDGWLAYGGVANRVLTPAEWVESARPF